ncbi:MAG: O-antigen ligase domain-containing protein [Flavobacterium sp.]|nr:MAG: O-antigen ligase domain-containing protein [Flavobacterium sp.]
MRSYLKIYANVLLFLMCLLEFSNFKSSSTSLILSNISPYFFILSFFLTFTNLSFGTSFTIFLLTVAPSFNLQLNSIFGSSWITFESPGLDAVLGWALGVQLVTRSKVSVVRNDDFLKFGVMLLHFWICISIAVTIARNLNENASSFTLPGFWLALQHVRDLSRGSAFFPLKDFFAYSTGVVFFLKLVDLRDQFRLLKISQMMVFFLLGVCCNFALNAFTKMTGKGFIRDGLDVGLNGFWPDLHAFAGLVVIVPLILLPLLKIEKVSRTFKAFVIFSLLSSIVSLYWSGSRFTLFTLLMISSVYFGIFSLRQRGRTRVALVFCAVFIVCGFSFILWRGYRGVNFRTISNIFHDSSFASINLVLSYRPEIWKAAIEMYSHFPFFGLGQGNFQFLSAIDWFSGSTYLTSVNGQNTHNFLLQSFVELGPVSLVIVVFILVAMYDRRPNSWGKVALGGLLGILLSNVFAHSLLIREMLMLTFFFLGLFCLQSEAKDNKLLNNKVILSFVLLLMVLIPLCINEIKESFQTPPFDFGTHCFINRELDGGWTSGIYRVSLPESAHKIGVEILELPPDTGDRDFDVNIKIVWSDNQKSMEKTFRSKDHPMIPLKLSFMLPYDLNGPASLLIKTSRCYVPFDTGLYYDSRLLGIKIHDLEIE